MIEILGKHELNKNLFYIIVFKTQNDTTIQISNSMYDIHLLRQLMSTLKIIYRHLLTSFKKEIS